MSTKLFDTLMLSYSLKGYYLLECSVKGEWGCESGLERNKQKNPFLDYL